MTRKAIFILTALLALFIYARPGVAGTTNWTPKPIIPMPPLFTDIVYSSPVEGASDFKVIAKITGQMQNSYTCDKANQADCQPSDWYLRPAMGVTPNPPAIKMAKVYYYLNDQAASAASVNMSEDPASGENKWKATVPIPAGAKKDDSITFYIVAVDSMGNVAAQVPDTGAVNATCPSSPASWNTVFSTPATNSCAQATSHTQCNVYVAGAPSCGTSYTLNDKTGDVCGQPNANGDQSVISQPKSDITGISAAADKDYLCVNMGLGASPPDANDPSPIEGYVVFITNPDLYDENPVDKQLKSSYALTYAPEMTATDPTLVRVLWDLGCVTDPNTANILDCKLIYVTGTDTKLQIGYNSGLKFIVKRSGTGNSLAKAYSLIGDTNKLSYIIGLTGELNISGATTYWVSDYTPAMGFYQKNQTEQVVLTPAPCPPPPNGTKCSVSGTDGTSAICTKSVSIPAQNKCKLAWNNSLDSSFITNYKLYRSATDAYVDGVTPLIATIPKTTLTYTDTIPQASLDGTKYYYFLSSYNDNSSDMSKKESAAATIAANVTTCTIEDWVPPAAPVITKAATPPGNEKKCKLEFTMPGADPSLKSFYMTRDNVPVNFTGQMGAAPGETSFSWTDPDTLWFNTTYSYKITALDLGDNTMTSAAVSCSPEDFEAPSGVTTAIASNLIGKLGVHLDWTASPEKDLAGYYVYWCKMNNTAIDCRASNEFAKINSVIIGKEDILYENDDAATFNFDSDYCFYIEACDNCDTAGTCPGNAGKPNCSGFPSGGADAKTWVKCISLSAVCDCAEAPAFPNNVTVTAPSEGKKCRVAWSKNYLNYDGTPFSKNPPEPRDLAGYKIMRNTVPGVPTPAQASPAGIIGVGAIFNETYIDTAVTNGQTYYYTVYAIDSSGNFSQNGAAGSSTEVQCAPQDKIAPAIPRMGTPDYEQTSCTPNWEAVTDAATITYQVYKCAGGSTSCNATATFAVDANCVMELDGVSCTDIMLTTDQEYTFCVTASDSATNTSAVYPAAALRTNCASCTPTARPQPVTGTLALATADQLNTKIYWTNSADYDQISGGINIYRCADSACSSKTKAKSCAQLLATSADVKNISFANPLTLVSEPAGEWYYGVTYQKDCGDPTTESFLSGTAIGSEYVVTGIIEAPCFGEPCIIISSCDNGDCRQCYQGSNPDPSKCSPLKEIDASAYINGAGTQLDKQEGRTTPKRGVSVYLLKSDGTLIEGPYSTDAIGNISFDVYANDISIKDKYQVVITINSADKAGMPCSDPNLFGSFKTTLGEDCGIQVVKNLTLKSNTTVKVTLPSIPKAGQGRSEIGNINCDNVVDMKDYALFKKNYDKDVAADPAAAPMDINQDGVVDSKDFVIFKKNFNRCVSGSFDADGNCLSAAPTKVTGLCK